MSKSLGIVLLVFASVAFGGIYYYGFQFKNTEDKVNEQKAVEERRDAAMESIADRLIAKANEKHAQQVDEAIRKGKVILGMSLREVVQAKGYPQTIIDGSEIYSEWREKGVVEVWHYGPEAFYVPSVDKYFHPDYVAFDRDGRLIGASDEILWTP